MLQKLLHYQCSNQHSSLHVFYLTLQSNCHSQNLDSLLSIRFLHISRFKCTHCQHQCNQAPMEKGSHGRPLYRTEKTLCSLFQIVRVESTSTDEETLLCCRPLALPTSWSVFEIHHCMELSLQCGDGNRGRSTSCCKLVLQNTSLKLLYSTGPIQIN